MVGGFLDRKRFLEVHQGELVAQSRNSVVLGGGAYGI